jgi:hypothetical protein
MIAAPTTWRGEGATMTETIDTGGRTCTPYDCECGAHLWDEVVEPDGAAYLLIGGLIVTAISCGCACGREHHWSPPTVRLRRILALRRRE